MRGTVPGSLAAVVLLVVGAVHCKSDPGPSGRVDTVTQTDPQTPPGTTETTPPVVAIRRMLHHRRVSAAAHTSHRPP